ncbi:FliM/FliN family flagellar motor C-terminal domain-containing protein [Acinetobacter sp. C26M]|uniref:FliM/FliN family flagellar motor C-terminal domain-containing protein n=1 Tax=unclassified Acinetobacter TaxID=196816 RepID=UPI002036F8E1|nr:MULTISPECIES: FliM/FliN family flagellar motor C-terminal domain-containing protein [unclassified Acinetobacter]USA45380.1 FliM/FliN family flagellar motor C-terminal domain-containing protein [Acinetobacter sp. C26M]USA48882.1 FliM/FliN family flagellar motor C-terminal domain-containing protein [Acinetobacter sp. C26G]
MKYGLGFLTKKEKSQLIAIISRSMIKWYEEWISSDIVPDIQLEECSDASHELLNFDFYCLDDNKPIVGFLKNDNDIWINILFENIKNIVPNDSVTAFLIERAKRDLLAKFYTNSGLKEFGSNLVAMNDVVFCGTPIIAYVRLGTKSFKLLLDSGFLNNKDEISLSKTSLSQKSFDSEVVVIQTKFILDKLSVSDFVDIQVGDVIKSNHRIAQPFSVFCRDNQIALAALGQTENHRAILLTSNHEIKK